jgi:hypothetical protein
MSYRLPTLALAAISVLAIAPCAAAQDLSGAWTGGYFSSDQSDVNAFQMTLKSAGSAFTGTAVESNGFGDASKVLFLTSMIQGTVKPDGSVNFVKTYDGSGDVSHSVSYTGRVSASGRRIQGAYDAGGATGRFEMVR